MTIRRARAPTGGPGECDLGSATIWVLAMSVLMLTVAAAVTLRTAAVLARHRAESAADLAALSAAAEIGVGPDPCAAARRIAARNNAAVQVCQLLLDPSGRSGTVTVDVRLAVHLPVVGVSAVLAHARAGRVADNACVPAAVRGPTGAVAC